MHPLPAVSPARVIDSRSPQGEAGRDPHSNTRPMALATDRNVVDEPQPATMERVGRVASAVAARLGRRPATVHQYIHSTTTLRPSDIVAEIANVSLELREAETFEKVLAPIREAAHLAEVSPFTGEKWLGELDELQIRVATLRAAIQRRIDGHERMAGVS